VYTSLQEIPEGEEEKNGDLFPEEGKDEEINRSYQSEEAIKTEDQREMTAE